MEEEEREGDEGEGKKWKNEKKRGKEIMEKQEEKGKIRRVPKWSRS